MNERTIAIGAEDMKGIPNRIGVSGGLHKVRPNIGAARSGLINVLITDHDAATEMLDVLKSEESVTSSNNEA